MEDPLKIYENWKADSANAENKSLASWSTQRCEKNEKNILKNDQIDVESLWQVQPDLKN